MAWAPPLPSGPLPTAMLRYVVRQSHATPLTHWQYEMQTDVTPVARPLVAAAPPPQYQHPVIVASHVWGWVGSRSPHLPRRYKRPAAAAVTVRRPSSSPSPAATRTACKAGLRGAHPRRGRPRPSCAPTTAATPTTTAATPTAATPATSDGGRGQGVCREEGRGLVVSQTEARMHESRQT